MKTVLAFTTASLAAFDERSSAVPTRTRGGIIATGRRGCSTGFAQLAGLFGVEVCDYAVMSNHLHIVLRNRPDVARQWSDDEVAIRWRKLFPQRDELTGEPREPDRHDVAMLTADADRLAILRSRLASLSWFMRCLCEWVARKANHEEGSFGRFWAGRFKSQPLLDESALLACSVYVDLNPVRAGIAATPEESQFTSGFDRIRSLAEHWAASPSSARGERYRNLRSSRTLALRIDAARDGRGTRNCRAPSTRCLHRKKRLQRRTQRFRIVTSQKFVRHLSLPATPCRLSRSSLDQAEVCVLVRRIRGFCRSTPKSTSCCSIGPAGRSVRTSAGQSRTTWLRSSTGWGSIDRIG